jgi:hypothetical protein
LNYEHFFSDTGRELPETYEWLNRVEQVEGIKIVRIGKSLDEIIEGKKILPSPNIRFCTVMAKIEPMEAYLKKEEATVYFGLRADEPERVGAIRTKNLFPVYPLRDAGIGMAMVYRIVGSRGLLPPAFFWQRLFDEVIAATGGIKGEGMAEIGRWPQWFKDRTFAWRSRPNCDYCFFKRLHEWVGLLWHYPERFEHAEDIEARIGNGPKCYREGGGFFWIREDFPLAKIRERAEEIFQKRVRDVCKLVNAHRQMDLFRDSIDEMDIAGTSCGLLCGK